MPIIPRNPLDWLTLFRQQINEIFTFLSALERKEVSGEQVFTPQVDIFETGDSFMIEIDLPGFERSDLSVSICCNTLVVEGIKREELRSEDVNYICLERCFGRFCKTVEIPPAVDSAKAYASYKSGVLSVAFPRLKNKGEIIREISIE